MVHLVEVLVEVLPVGGFVQEVESQVFQHHAHHHLSEQLPCRGQLVLGIGKIHLILSDVLEVKYDHEGHHASIVNEDDEYGFG